MGCYERTLAWLIEKYAGKFPTWLCPEQVRVLPISEKYEEYANKVCAELKKNDIDVTVDNRSEKIGFKIREARLDKLPYMLVVGQQEEADGTVSVRSRFAGNEGTKSLDEFIDAICKEIRTKEIRKLDDVEFMIGGHQSTYASVGQVLVKSGIACAGGHAFKLTLTGVGTHAISPQDGSDVISTAMQIIDSWQSMLSRQIDPQQPVVLSVCSIHAGEMGATNVLPSTAVFSGTIRTFNDPLRESILKKMCQRAESISKFNGCTCMMEEEYQFPVLVNHDAVTQIVKQAAVEVVGPNAVFTVPEPSIGSEDFAQYAQKIPASYFMFGVRNNEKGFVYGGHHPKFDMDEDGLLYDVEIFLHALRHLLPLSDS